MPRPWMPVVALLLASACRREAPPAPADASASDPRLPDRAGAFVAGPLVTGEGFVRRTYRRGPVHVDVTFGDPGQAPVALDQWIKMSASYPPIALGIAPTDGAGFYDCTGTGALERCDGHIHLRSGAHVELMSYATASRADLDEVLRALPLASVAKAS